MVGREGECRKEERGRLRREVGRIGVEVASQDIILLRLEIFFFKQKTAYEISTRDWNSDVCSSDLSALSMKLIQSVGQMSVQPSHSMHFAPSKTVCTSQLRHRSASR